VACTAPVCFIIPPYILQKIAEEGTPKQQKAARDNLVTSSGIRSRRVITGTLLRNLDMDVQALGIATAPSTGEKQSVYDAHNGEEDGLPGTLERQTGGAAVQDSAVNEAYDGADTTYRFYKEVYDRDSIDGQGMEMISSVHFSTEYDNAFWNGSEMVYGDAGGIDIIAAGSLTGAIDVIGHELTHGVTERTAKLVYADQPGALNESCSDVFGSLVKQWSLGQTADQADWLIGAGILEPGHGEALRSMSAPGTAFDGDPQPAHMDNFVHPPGGRDHGGVHYNSGIPNRAFYLAATAIGGNAWEKAGRIWYVTLTDKLSANSQFEDAANATVEVAGDLFSGGPEQEAVHKAWQTVGVLA
jgi:Zn-dependent metalloprotease